MKRGLLVGIFVVTGAMTIALAACHEAPAAASDPKTIDILKLKDNLYVLTSSDADDGAHFSGGNVAVLVTDDGVTLVDTKLAAWGEALLDAIRHITPKPVTRIINTHTHGDHTGNNDKFGATVEVVTHENTKANMATMDAFKGDQARFLPTRVFTDKMTVGAGKDRIDLHYFGPGHTSGDAFVVFPEHRVLHAGDMFPWKGPPLCSRAYGGNCLAYHETLARVVAGIQDVDTIIPGHSAMMTPQDLRDFQHFMADLTAHAQAAYTAGLSGADATAAFKMDQYPGFKTDRMDTVIDNMYDQLKKQN